jgi:chromodomain-helicase-DNA-binding protein 1
VLLCLPFLLDPLQVDRIISMRPDETKSFLVKWEGLPYAEATWEEERDVHDAVGGLAARDAFDQREQRLMEPSKGIEAQRSGLSKKKLAELKEQPDFLQGGQLRDYQLEGLNWLTYSWLKVGNCTRRSGHRAVALEPGLWHLRAVMACAFM